MKRSRPADRRNAAFGVFLLALGGVTISASVLFAIALGLGWDGMPWTISLFAALLLAISSSARVEPSPPDARPRARRDMRATQEA